MFLNALSRKISPSNSWPQCQQLQSTMRVLTSHLHYSRCSGRQLGFFSVSLPIFHKFSCSRKVFKNLQCYPTLIVRSCGNITAKSSSELRKKHNNDSGPDEKLRALRELFVKPNINIDAYIIPSQDAHQVLFCTTIIKISRISWLSTKIVCVLADLLDFVALPCFDVIFICSYLCKLVYFLMSLLFSCQENRKGQREDKFAWPLANKWFLIVCLISRVNSLRTVI